MKVCTCSSKELNWRWSISSPAAQNQTERSRSTRTIKLISYRFSEVDNWRISVHGDGDCLCFFCGGCTSRMSSSIAKLVDGGGGGATGGVAGVSTSDDGHTFSSDALKCALFSSVHHERYASSSSFFPSILSTQHARHTPHPLRRNKSHLPKLSLSEWHQYVGMPVGLEWCLPLSWT